jgi:hypothetical protein
MRDNIECISTKVIINKLAIKTTTIHHKKCGTNLTIGLGTNFAIKSKPHEI